MVTRARSLMLVGGVLLGGALLGGASGDSAPLERAEALLQRARLERNLKARSALADEAAALCARAEQAAPKDPLPHLLLARALSIPDPDHPEACRAGACERASAELDRARALDTAGAEGEQIASEMGIVLSRLGRFQQALVEYDRALGLVPTERRPSSLDDSGARAILFGNSAETLMALGRLAESIDRYRQAGAASFFGGLEWELSQWGLGVALDRDGQVEKSRAAIERALDLDPTLARLDDEDVFFEPAGDKHYYQALGHEVAGDREPAVAGWRAFLAEVPASPYAARARAHLELLRRAPAGHDTDPGQVKVVIGMPQVLRAVRGAARLKETITARQQDLRTCYLRALRTEPRLSTELRLGIELAPAGWVGQRARVLLSTANAPKLSRCIELAASNWRFPPSIVQENEEFIVPIQFGREE